MTYGGGRGRRPSGTPIGGQFAPRGRSEGGLVLIEKLSEFEAARMRKYLDRASNGLGKPIAAEQRVRVEAFIEAPTQERWESARSVIVSGKKSLTLWQAVMGFSGFVPASNGDWVGAPTRQQVLNALDYATRS